MSTPTAERLKNFKNKGKDSEVRWKDNSIMKAYPSELLKLIDGNWGT